jgi:enamine deaminase RidA (YjgF/YER057c/UK114 family)
VSQEKTRFTPINPPSLGSHPGYSNGMLAHRGGHFLFIAGQVGWNEEHQMVGPGFVEQLGKALENVLQVVKEAGGAPTHIGRLTIYVVNHTEYLAHLHDIGVIYRQFMSQHYPAMTLVEVSALLEPGAKVEIEATAVLP